MRGSVERKCCASSSFWEAGVRESREKIRAAIASGRALVPALVKTQPGQTCLVQAQRGDGGVQTASLVLGPPRGGVFLFCFPSSAGGGGVRRLLSAFCRRRFSMASFFSPLFRTFPPSP